MHSASDDHTGAKSYFLRITLKICDNEALDIVSSVRFPNYCLSNFIFGLKRETRAKEVTKICVSIWKTVCNKDFIIGICKIQSETECVKIPSLLFLILVLPVRNIPTTSKPTYTVVLGTLLAVLKNSHT